MEFELRDALETLQPVELIVLDGYFGCPPASERVLSRGLGVSRHRLRDTLLSALAKITTVLGERGQIKSDDWIVAREIWREGRNTQEVAGRLCLSIREVVRARNRVLDVLAQGVGRLSSKAALNMEQITMSDDDRGKDFLNSEATVDLLRELSHKFQNRPEALLQPTFRTSPARYL